MKRQADADLDRVRRECGQRDRGQAHEQKAADALEQSDGAALLDVCTAVLNDTLEGAYRMRYSGFRPANDEGTTAAAA